jgi:DNA-binding SARP family transcriptional activator
VDTHELNSSVDDLERPGALVLHLFAGPYVTVGAARREVPEGSKQLLAFVALRRRRVERRQVAGTLWPLGDDERAAGNLRSALWRLRRADIDLMVVDKCSLALRADVLVDTHVVEQWATRLIEGRATPGDLAVPPSAPDALNLLPGFYEDWALMERERIRQRILHALEALSEALAAAGRYADAIEAAMLATTAEPLRESAQRVLIKAHLAEGNLTEAHRSYRAYRDLVHRELGVVLTEDFAVNLGIPAFWQRRAEGARASRPVIPGSPADRVRARSPRVLPDRRWGRPELLLPANADERAAEAR